MTRRRLWILLPVLLLLATAMVDIRITGPRVSVRWADDIDAAARTALERRFDLRNGEPDRQSSSTWQYELSDRSRPNIEAIVGHPAARDTHYIDRDALTVARPAVDIGLRAPALPFPFRTTAGFPDARQLFQLQSAVLILAGGVLLWAAGLASVQRRRQLTIAACVLAGAAALAFPISPFLVRMSDANQHVESRSQWEGYAAVNAVRFEAHLTYVILGQLDAVLGRGPAAPETAVVTVTRAATVGFIAAAIAVGYLEAWSPPVVRYLALGLLAPSALMYFGWREFGYLALCIAAFPLVRRGLQNGGGKLEIGGALCGLGAALHGWGLVSLAGACAAALAAPAPWLERLGRMLRVAASGTAAYLGWVAIYVIILKLPIGRGHAEAIPWRPWFQDGIFDERINPAIFTATGVWILAMQAWVVGAPLILVAASAWKTYRDDVRVAAAYAMPSLAFLVLVFHTQGLHEDMDVVFGIFPAIYALTWICAQNARSAVIAAALLVSAHLAFWRIVLDTQFETIRP